MANERIFRSADAAAKRWLRLTTCEFRAYRYAIERNGALLQGRDRERWQARMDAANRAYRVWERRDAERSR